MSAFLFSLFLASPIQGAQASIDQAPPSFPYRNSEAIFVDFKSVSHRIVYDFTAKTATVESEIVFDAPKAGYPIFDLIPDPQNIRLDDRETEASLVSDPDGVSKFRVLGTVVAPGSHRFTLTHILTENVDFRETGVASAFWMSDLDDRRYLEQYLPTNFEFDAYPISMRIEVIHAVGIPHEIHANGEVKESSENTFDIEFPSFYTTSSMFFHLSPKGSIPSTRFIFHSVDGRKLPVEIYSRTYSLDGLSKEVTKVLNELEGDYGSFPHAKVIVYGAGRGGMEYSGATMTASFAIGHELFHSYNARAVMPAQGNAGWVDEAISSWRDNHYSNRSVAGSPSIMAGHSVWTRMTDDDAYTKGAAFLAWIAGRMSANGKDLKVFLKEYFNENFFHTMTTDQFKRAMESYSGFDLTSDFDRYIYGKEGVRGSKPSSTWGYDRLTTCRQRGEKMGESISSENPYHPRLTEKQLRALL